VIGSAGFINAGEEPHPLEKLVGSTTVVVAFLQQEPPSVDRSNRKLLAHEARIYELAHGRAEAYTAEMQALWARRMRLQATAVGVGTSLIGACLAQNTSALSAPSEAITLYSLAIAVGICSAASAPAAKDLLAALEQLRTPSRR
jgi:hypothetical protein